MSFYEYIIAVPILIVMSRAFDMAKILTGKRKNGSLAFQVSNGP